MYTRPWISGPREILQHAVNILSNDDDSSLRIAYLTIDNAVELILKTFLNLPKSVTGVRVDSERYDENKISFPALLDLIQEVASDKVKNIDLTEINWYHRLRNQLYHEGNGLTVEKKIVINYLNYANELLFQLFGTKLSLEPEFDYQILVKFLDAWKELEKAILKLNYWANIESYNWTEFENIEEALKYFKFEMGFDYMEFYYPERIELERLYSIWCDVTEKKVDYRKVLNEDTVNSVGTFIDYALERAEQYRNQYQDQ